MKQRIYILLGLQLLLCFTSYSITITGKVIDFKSGIPLSYCKITSSAFKDTVLTDATGSFSFDISEERRYVCISFGKTDFMMKTFCIPEENFKKTLSIKLKRASDFVFDLKKTDSTLIGKKLSTVCKSYQLEESDYRMIYEPPGIARGIVFHTGDGSTLNFYTDRTACFKREDNELLLAQKITGIAYVDKTCSQKHYFGNGMIWSGIYGHECP
jgi:hypothetical protein